MSQGLASDVFIIPRFSGAKIDRSTNQSLTTATITAISWDNQILDTDDYWEGVTNPTRLTVPTAGLYLVTALFSYSADATGQRQLRFHVDGSEVETFATFAQGANAAGLTATALLSLAAGSYVEISGYQDSGGNLNLVSNSGKTLRVAIARLGQVPA